MRRIEKRQLSVGVIQMCLMAPGPLTSASVTVFAGSMTRRFTAIPNRRAYANEKEILLTWYTAIWRTTRVLQKHGNSREKGKGRSRMRTESLGSLPGRSGSRRAWQGANSIHSVGLRPGRGGRL